jgi:poly-gamma-glutamate synthesis protein (capsule biosynthesis protein)
MVFLLSMTFQKDSTMRKSERKAEDITLFLCGDVMTGRGIDQVFPQSVDPKLYESYVKNAGDYVRIAERENGPIDQPVSYSYIWGDALNVWKKMHPDFKLINLETSITTNDEPWPGKGIHYRMHPENVQVLETAGFDFCSLANNHVLDWKREGLLETLRTLENLGVKYSGAGRSLEEARKPSVFPKDNSRVIVFAYGSRSSGIPGSWAAGPRKAGVNFLPDNVNQWMEDLGSRINSIKQEDDIVVLSIHWGDNWGYDIPGRQKQLAHRLIDEAGVDLVSGHSSHHPRGIEVYRDKLIIYGTGDFINDYEGIGGHEQYRDDLTLMYFPRLDPQTGELLSLKLMPMQIKNFSLHHVSKEDTNWLHNTLNEHVTMKGSSVTLNQNGCFILKWD